MSKSRTQIDLNKPTNVYKAAIHTFRKKSYEEIASVGVNSDLYQAKVFKKPDDNQLYILYYPGTVDNMESIVKYIDHELKRKLENNVESDVKINLEELANANKILITTQAPGKFQIEINKFKKTNQSGFYVVNSIAKIINSEAPKELGFFQRRSWIKDLAIGVGISLAIVGAITAITLTAGIAAIPIVASVGAAVGVAGFAAIGTAFVAGCAAFAVGLGKILDRRNKHEHKQINQSQQNKIAEEKSPEINNLNSSKLNNWDILVKAAKDEKARQQREGRLIEPELPPSSTSSQIYDTKQEIVPTPEEDSAFNFIKENINFFIQPFENLAEFSKTIENNYITRCAKPLSYIMIKVLNPTGNDYSRIHQFQEALLGDNNLAIDNKVLNEKILKLQEKIQKMKTDIDQLKNQSSSDQMSAKIAKLESEYVDLQSTLNRLETLKNQSQSEKGLKNGNEQPLRCFLNANPEFVNVLNIEMKNSYRIDAIKQWPKTIANDQLFAKGKQPETEQQSSNNDTINSPSFKKR